MAVAISRGGTGPHWTISRGTAFDSGVLELRDASGAALDLTDCTLRLLIGRTLRTVPTIEVLVGTGIVVVDVEAGQMAVRLSAIQTASFASGTFVYELTVAQGDELILQLNGGGTASRTLTGNLGEGAVPPTPDAFAGLVEGRPLLTDAVSETEDLVVSDPARANRMGRRRLGPILDGKADAEETAAALSAKQSAVLAPGVRGPGTISQSLVVAVLDLGTPITAWGADPTGIADSTAAIQAALNTLEDSKSIRIPHGRYRISASLQIPNKKGWSITTEGRPQIIQYTDNIPIFVTPDSTETSPAHFSVGELSLAYANIQSVANTNAICIKVGTAGFYEASFGRLAFINCFRGISSASGLVWGCLFNHLFYDASCTGSMLYLAGIAGQPTNVINKGFSRGHNLSEPLMNFNTARIRINSFETNEHYTGQSFIRATSSYVSCGLLVFEEGTFANQAALFDISTSRFAADIIEVQNFRVNAPTGNQSAGIFKDTGGSGSRIKGGIVHITGTSIIAGTPVFIIAAGGLTSAEYIFDAWDWDNDGWRSTDGFSVGARTRMRVLGWEVGNYQQNAASTSLDANSPKLWRWIGDLSQNVIMVAPFKRLVSNLEFVFIIEATTTGGGSVIIRNSDGSTELATLSAGTRRVCKIGNNGSINNGWYVSN